MDGDYSYLEKGFNASLLKIPQIKKILIYHKVNFPSNAKKAELVGLFNKEIKGKADKLKKESDTHHKTAKPIKNAKKKESKASKNSNVKGKNLFVNSSDSEIKSDNDVKSDSDSNSDDSDNSDNSDDSDADSSSNSESVSNVSSASGSENSSNSSDDSSDSASDSEKDNSFSNKNTFQASKSKKRSLPEDKDDSVSKSAKKTKKTRKSDIFDISSASESEDSNDKDFEKLLSKNLKDSTSILKSPERDLSPGLKSKKDSGKRLTALLDSKVSKKSDKLHEKTPKTSLSAAATPIKKALLKRELSPRKSVASPLKSEKLKESLKEVKSTPKKQKTPAQPPKIVKSLPENDFDALASQLGVVVQGARPKLFDPAKQNIVFGTPKADNSHISNKSFKSPKAEKVQNVSISELAQKETPAMKPLHDEDEDLPNAQEDDDLALDVEDLNENDLENDDDDDDDDVVEVEELSASPEISEIAGENEGNSDVLDKFESDFKEAGEKLLSTEAAEQSMDAIVEKPKTSAGGAGKFVPVLGYLKFFVYSWLLLTAVAGGYWYHQQRVLVGYCGYSIDRKTFSNPENNVYIAKAEDFLTQLKPKCVDCPEKATCFPYFDLTCHDDYMAIKPLSYFVTGKKCVPNLRKQKRIETMVQTSLNILRARNAAIKCGEGDDCEAGIKADEIHDILHQIKSPDISDEEFNEIWMKAEKIIEKDSEIKTVRQV